MLFGRCFSGTKGVAKAMKEISTGAQKWQGEKWFAELSDKRMKSTFIVNQYNTTWKLETLKEIILNYKNIQ